MNLKRIVAGTDFSAPAEHALDVALRLAASVGATVTLVHAYEIPTIGFPETSFFSTADARQAFQSAASSQLDACVAKYQDRGMTLRSALRMGAPWTEVNAVAVEEDADLVVVGSWGHRAFSKFLLGSVAERVLRTATRPVLVVPEARAGATEDPKTPLRRILVASDFGEDAQHAIDTALDLGATFHAQVRVVHAWSIPTLLFPAELSPPVIAFEQEARKGLAAIVEAARRRDSTVEGVLRSGAPAHEILAAAKEHDADLVILGTHGRKGLPRLLLGSVAERVARSAEVPVMIVSAHDRPRV